MQDAAPNQDDRLLYDTKDAARLLSVSVRTVKLLASRGELNSIQIGRLRRFRRSDLESFIASKASASRPDEAGGGIAPPPP